MLDTPNRAALIELTLFADKRGGRAFEDPDVIVRGLFTDQRSNDPLDPSEFGMKDEIDGLSLRAANLKETSRTGLIETRMSRGFSVGATKGRSVSGVVGRMFMRRLGGRPLDTSGGRSSFSFLSFPSLLRDVICPVTASIRMSSRLGKRGATLDLVIANETEDSSLGKDGSVFVK